MLISKIYTDQILFFAIKFYIFANTKSRFINMMHTYFKFVSPYIELNFPLKSVLVINKKSPLLSLSVSL